MRPLLHLAATALACLLAFPAAEADGDDGRVTVYYPAGGCQTGRIEIQVFVRATKTWAPHPSHPQVATDTCQPEDPGQLLNELRLRCIDPQGKAAPSDWVVGADLATPASPGACKPG